MNYEEAKNCVLAELEMEFGEGIQLMDDQIIEKPYGWFFYNTKEFIETGNPEVALMSNTPFVFTQEGKKYLLRMSCSVSEAVNEIERNHFLSRGT